MAKRVKRQDEMPAIRNFVAKNRWQRGGVHEKTNKTKRHQSKQQLKQKIRIKSDADFLYQLFGAESTVVSFSAAMILW